MVINEKEFSESLERLSELYENGKQCVTLLEFSHPETMSEAEKRKLCRRLRQILQDMRDLSAVNMQKLHFKIDN